jgi:hypothetical protein
VLLCGCDADKFSTLVITAQVARTMSPESNTASVLLGEATVENVLQDSWMETPEPSDTSFIGVFPVNVTPVGGAAVKLNSGTVSERLRGIYFEPALDLEFKTAYDLDITLDDDRRVTAHAVLPDSFSVVTPAEFDTVEIGTDTLRVHWSKSDSANTYIVGIGPADSSAAVGWSDSQTDTFCVVPAAAFKDSLGTAVPGTYVLNVTAVNGGWKKSGLDLLLSGGNVSGAVGVFGCAVYARPVLLVAR